MLLLDAAHHHAQMPRLNDYADALGFDHFLDGFGDLGSEALLNLETAGEDFDQAWDFAETDHSAVGNVGDVDLAEERQQVVFAEAEDFNVFHDHNFVVTLGEKRHGLMNALWSTGEAFALGVFAQTDERFAHRVLIGGAG